MSFQGEYASTECSHQVGSGAKFNSQKMSQWRKKKDDIEYDDNGDDCNRPEPNSLHLRRQVKTYEEALTIPWQVLLQKFAW